jgi:hypothetical protein
MRSYVSAHKIHVQSVQFKTQPNNNYVLWYNNETTSWSTNDSRDAGVKIIWLLGRCARQVRKRYAGTNMVNLWAECVFIHERYFPSKSSAAVRETFSDAYRDREVPAKTSVPEHHLVTNFWGVESVCDKCSSSDKTAEITAVFYFTQCISCNNGIKLQECNITIGIVALCMKGFVYSAWDYVVSEPHYVTGSCQSVHVACS